MKCIKTPMKGMNDYLPGDMRLREYVIGQIKSTYGSYGFCPIPPCEEFADSVCDEFFSLPPHRDPLCGAH